MFRYCFYIPLTIQIGMLNHLQRQLAAERSTEKQKIYILMEIIILVDIISLYFEINLLRNILPLLRCIPVGLPTYTTFFPAFEETFLKC